MSNGITYVTPDPCPHCGGRVSTGMAGDEDSERYMYVCGQCDTWFEQKGYPTTSKRYVTEESEVDALRARVAELEAAIRILDATETAHRHAGLGDPSKAYADLIALVQNCPGA